MKHCPRLFLTLVGLLSSLPLAHAGEKGKLRVLAQADQPHPGVKVERRIMMHPPGQPPEMEKVAFLGVETGTVSDALTAQLALPKNTGLTVRSVEAGSPAASALQPHDIILKLDDQLLIQPRQFSVLVRNHQPGDEVTLTYVRVGKQATVKVKLGEHEVPKMLAFDFQGEGSNMDVLMDAAREIHGGTTASPEHMRRMLSLLDRNGETRAAGAPGPHSVTIAGGHPPAPGMSAQTVSPGNSKIFFNDDQGSLELTMKDGKKNLVAKDMKGAELYSGPIDTPEQRTSLPPTVRDRLEKIESMHGFSFEPGKDFDGNVMFANPAHTKIEFRHAPGGLGRGEPAVF